MKLNSRNCQGFCQFADSFITIIIEIMHNIFLNSTQKPTNHIDVMLTTIEKYINKKTGKNLCWNIQKNSKHSPCFSTENNQTVSVFIYTIYEPAPHGHQKHNIMRHTERFCLFSICFAVQTNDLHLLLCKYYF